MQLTPASAEIYVRNAFSQMLAVADQLGEPQINQRPHGPTTNSVSALVVHCCAVCEFWLGHVAQGRPSNRERATEFDAESTLQELHALVERAVATVVQDLANLEAGLGTDEGGRQFLPGGDTSDAAVVVHVIEELFQHLGHMELTADALTLG